MIFHSYVSLPEGTQNLWKPPALIILAADISLGLTPSHHLPPPSSTRHATNRPARRSPAGTAQFNRRLEDLGLVNKMWIADLEESDDYVTIYIYILYSNI